ncbi:MAG: ROK family protein [Alphaproteobacteria bacterium]
MGVVRIGVDLGGSKIEAIALGGGSEVLTNRRIVAPSGDYRATLDAIAGLVADIEGEIGATGSVGLGMPGSLSRASGRVKNANSTWLIGKPFERDLAEALGREVRLANDADCFALSEATDGAGAGAKSVFGAILGTGVGGGIVIDGRLLAGVNAIAGEWGHNPLPSASPPLDDDERARPPCYCGRRGCIETFLSGPGLVADYARAGGGQSQPRAIVARAGSGEKTALDTLHRYRGRLARALAGVINILDPHIIVLGGGLSLLPGLCEAVPSLWEDAVFSDRIDTRLALARHGDASGVRGAAWLWPEDAGTEDAGA